MGSQKTARRGRQTVQGSFAGWQRVALLSILIFAGLGLSVGSAFVSGVPRVSAAANAIQIENTQPGDPTWDDFSANPSPTALSGYSSPISVNHGQTVNFYITTTSASVQIKIYRMGWYGGTGARLMQTMNNITGHQQSIPNPDPVTGIVVCDWQVTASLAVPSNWVTGVYLAKLIGSSGDKSFIFFNVRNDGGHEDFVFQTSVTTYEAYNTYGITSLYNNGPNPTYPYPAYGHATKVSFDRPFNPGDSNGAGHFLWYEYPMLRWAEKNGFDMTYTTDIDTDLNTNPLTNHKAFLSVGHDEYWSKAMRDNVQAAINAGVNVGFFGANDVYWQVRFEPNSHGVPDRVMVGYKDYATINQAPGPDPQWNVNNAIVTTRFRDLPVNQPENGLVGVMFLDENDTPDGRPYVVTNASSWVFANTGFVNGTSIPGIVGYEFDNSFTDPTTHGYLPQYGSASPAGLQILSNSLVQGDNGAEIAQSTIYTAPSGARVFAAGTIEWSWGLDNFGGRNTANAGIQQATANIFYNFNGGSPPPPPPPPPPGIYLQDNFESGNLTQWNGPFGTGSAGVVTGPSVHSGTYSAQLIDPSGTGQYATLTQNLVNSPGANTYTRFYFQVSDTSQPSTLAIATDSTGANGTNNWVALYDNGSHGIVVYFRPDSGNPIEFDSAPNLITANTWYGLQIQLSQATSGVGNVWLNGTLLKNALTGQTGVSGNLSASTPINALTLWNEAPGTTIDFDDVIVSDHDNGTVNSGGSPPAFNPTNLSFGNQNIGTTSAAQTVTLTNASGATLHISATSIIGNGAGDFAKGADTCTGQAIAVNATCTVGVTFSPTAVGNRNATLSFTDDGAGSPQSVALSGTGVAVGPAVSFNPANLSFGNQNTGTTSAAKTVTVTNNGNATLHITTVTLIGTNAGDFAKSADTCTGAAVAVNATCTVSVTFSPTAVSGRNAALSFADDAAGSPQTYALTGTGVAPTISFSPTSLTYPSQGIGTTSAAQTISVINNGTAALHVTSVTFTGTNAGDFAKSADTCTGAAVAPLAECSVSVTFSPTATGSRSATISFADDVAGSPQTVALSGTGVTVAPGISFSAPTLTFANQGVGTTSAAQTVTVTNNGNASLHITSVGVTGTNAGDFAKSADTCTGATVAANATCTVSVTFTPTAAGSRNASLSFTDDAPSSPQAVALSGTGMQVGVFLQDGFESGNLGLWSTPAGTGSATVQTSVVNSGTYALAMANGANQYVITSQSLSSAQAHTFSRLYFRITNASVSFSLASATDINGNNLWAVVYDAGSHGLDVYFWNGSRTRFDFYSGTNLIQANAWYSLEIELNEATSANGGVGNVWLNGNKLGGVATGSDLSATNYLSKLFLWNDASSATTYFDDVVVSNVYNGPLGSAAGITFTPSSVNFGSQNTGTTSAAQTVTAKNTGTASLHLTTVVITGANAADFAIGANTCNSATLAPNATCTVGVTFTPSIVGTRSASLSFTDDAPLSPQAVALTGAGATSGISFNPTSVIFGSQTVSTTGAPQTITVTNSGAVSLHITSVTPTGTNASDFAKTSDTCTGATVAANATCTVTLTFTPGATGARSASLSFVDDAPNSPQIVSLAGTGATAAPVVSFNPTTGLNFGNQNTGTTSAPKSVTVTNTGTAALHVSIVALAGTNSGDYTISADTCTGATVAINATCSVSVTFTPSATGARSATLTFTDDAGGSPQTVSLSGTGTAAGISFTPATLSYGNQGTGSTSAAQPVTVTNSGTAALHVTSVTLTGTNAGDFAKSADTCTGQAIAAGATCTVSVTFTPTATGARSASLSFADDAPSSPQTVAVSGTGTQIGVYLQDGFESGNLSQWTGPVGTGTATVESTVVNRGSNALAMTNGANQYTILSQNLTGGAQAHTFSRLYFRITNASVSFSVASATDSAGNNMWAVVYDAGSHGLDVYFWNGARTRFDFYSSTNLITANTWYSLEIELNEATTGAGNVWLNGTSLGGITGNLSATNNLSRIYLWNDASSTTTYFDDVIVSNQYNGVLP